MGSFELIDFLWQIFLCSVDCCIMHEILPDVKESEVFPGGGVIGGHGPRLSY